MATVETFTFINETSANIAPGAKPCRAKKHVCDICQKSFKRSEHLLRHTRAHLQQRPFQCRFCASKFARKDLLVRHEKTLHALEYDRDKALPKRRGPVLLAAAPQRTPSPDSGTSPEDNGATGDTIVVLADDPATATSTARDVAPDLMTAPPVPAAFPEGTTDNAPMRSLQTNLMVHEDPDGALSAGQLVDIRLAQDPYQTALHTDQNFAMPSSLDGCSFFTMIDGTSFSQADFPMQLMDLDVSALGSDGSTSSIHFDPTLTLSTPDGSHCSDSASLGMNQAARGSVSSHFHDIHRPGVILSKRGAIDEATRSLILQDLRDKFGIEEDRLQKIPSARTLDNFLCRFFQFFYRHLPVFHIATSEPAAIPKPLLLAVCSLGALYSLHPKHAATLRSIASSALSFVQARKYTGHQVSMEPLWQIQCKLLFVFGAVFGGNPSSAGDGISDISSLVRSYILRRPILSAPPDRDRIPSWKEWISFETEKRVLCGIYILSSLNSATYGTPPSFTQLRDLDFEVPAHEVLWEAETKEEWERLMSERSPGKSPSISAVLREILPEKSRELPQQIFAHIGSFAAIVIMHGFRVHMHSYAQISLPLSHLDVGIPGFATHTSLGVQIEEAITTCNEFLNSWEAAHGELYQNLNEESPVFNCQSLLRLSFLSSFSCTWQFDHVTLLCQDKPTIQKVIDSYVTAPLPLGASLTKAAERAMFCFTAPVRAGHMLTRKMSAFTWSVEHAVACWVCNLFLGKWIYVTELQARHTPLDQDEESIFTTLKETLSEMDNPYDAQTSLAAQVSRQWASFMDDVWVWEVTLRMGGVLRDLADAYDRSWQ
ncbi:Zinc finger C2H2-type protein [Pleurostoma richardsiae]|uniref:Zinc finger C2H2-type protein n=1 Tax=Pleurostoma richardsiae TaxID=41990 RepID=A0AA38VSC4_9PEZI|nr:Zinc finger C2H2-type protein [Pleurostoma richardsiae]